jgi:SAM-dependent methyltransferase
MSGAREIESCEVCGGKALLPVLDLGAHPMCDDLVPVGDARRCKEYPISILYCAACRTAHQRFQVPKAELFPKSYHYRSRFTADVLKGMAGLVDSCEARFGGLKDKLVVDVGCNDGSLLDFFRGKGARTAGIEPTGAAADAKAKGHAVYEDYLSEELAKKVSGEHGPADLITFTNVFAHIEDLPAVLAAVRRLMKPSTVLVVENHYLGSVLDGNQFDTFYHEHPRTYSAGSFAAIARSLGAGVLGVEFPARYGGNIRVFLGGEPGGALPPELEAREAAFGARFAALAANVERWRKSKSAELAALAKAHGPLLAKAFPGRAAILVKLLGLDERTVAAVHEKPGSLKIGHYLPGTRIPIRSDDELFARADKDSPLLNMAWHIPAEIRAYLKEHGWRGPVLDILGEKDFRAP